MRARKRKIAATVAVAGLLVAGLAGGASAATQHTDGAWCYTEVRVASVTTGQTWHHASPWGKWDKGIKNKSSASSYTGSHRVARVTTEAPTIHSSGYACR